MRQKRGRVEGSGSWFTHMDFWPTLVGVGNPPNSAPILPQTTDQTFLVQYTPGVSTPGPEIGAGNQVATGVEVLSGRLRVDVMAAPSIGITNQIANITVGLIKVEYDVDTAQFTVLNPADPATASRPWLYLEARGLQFQQLVNGSSFRDPFSSFGIKVPRVKVEGGEALVLYISNGVPTGGVSIAAFLNGRLKVRDLE